MASSDIGKFPARMRVGADGWGKLPAEGGRPAIEHNVKDIHERNVASHLLVVRQRGPTPTRPERPHAIVMKQIKTKPQS